MHREVFGLSGSGLESESRFVRTCRICICEHEIGVYDTIFFSLHNLLNVGLDIFLQERMATNMNPIHAVLKL